MAVPGRLAITGIGTTTSLGGNRRQCCASLRAGLARTRETDLYTCMLRDPNAGERTPALVAPARAVDPATTGLDRLLGLAGPALAEAVSEAGLERKDFARATLHLALPQSGRPGLDGIEDTFATALCRGASLPAPAAVTASRIGNSAFVDALRVARRATANDADGLAIVLCVDSLLDAATLEWLDVAGRLKSERSPEGVIAGEAAAVLVLERRRAAEARGATARAMLDGLGVGEDKATAKNGLPWTGEALSAALTSATARLEEPARPPWVLTDLNGDRSRSQEWGYVVTRMHELLSGLRHTWYVADSLGDVGAAVGGMLAARAADAFERGYAPGRSAYVLLSSDDGARGAAVLAAPTSGGA
jgi:3-oxoacyl-[acyl-carrier-protein] synthase-1